MKSRGAGQIGLQLALDDLSAMDPKSYPPQKQEVLYPISSVFVSPAGPISMDSPNLVKEKKVNDEASLEVTPGLEQGVVILLLKKV